MRYSQRKEACDNHQWQEWLLSYLSMGSQSRVRQKISRSHDIPTVNCGKSPDQRLAVTNPTPTLLLAKFRQNCPSSPDSSSRTKPDPTNNSLFVDRTEDNLPTMEEILKTVSADGSSIMPKLAPHLSRHLLFPLIQFEGDQAEEKGEEEKAKAITIGKMKLLEDTNMTDYVASMYCELHGVKDAPAEYNKKRQEVLAQLEKHEQATEKIADLLTQDDVVNGLRSDKVANLEFLKNQHGVSQLNAGRESEGLC